MSVLIDIADAVVAELNAPGSPLVPAEGEPLAVAQRLYLPRFSLEEMAALHVTVVPKATTVERADRTRRQFDHSVDVAVQKRTEEKAELDGLMSLVEAIGELFKDRRLTRHGASLVGTEILPVFSPEHMEQMHQFTSVLTLTFRLIG